MKINFVLATIALAISGLIAFAFYSWCAMTESNLIVSIFGGFSLCCTFIGTLSITFPESRTTINSKVASGVFALLFLITIVR